MSQNKKIHYGDNFPFGINESTVGELIPPGSDLFTFDRTDITFDSLLQTFDEK